VWIRQELVVGTNKDDNEGLASFSGVSYKESLFSQEIGIRLKLGTKC